MYHSITFENTSTGEKFNTFDNFDLMPDGRPDVASPELKENYIDVPGTDGTLDYTEALNGRNYKDRTGSWEFYVLNTYSMNGDSSWSIRWKNIMKYLHGKRFDKIYLEDESRQVLKYNGLENVLMWEPEWYYKGRIKINEWRSDPQYSKVVIDYTLEPYKYRYIDTTKGWLWNDLFDSNSVNPINGPFTVYTKKKRSLVNESSNTVSVTTDCSSAMTVTLPGSSEPIVLPAGQTENAFTIPPNGVIATFIGNGTVTLSYDGSFKNL